VPHAFANLADEPVWTVGIVIPGGFERMFAEQAEYLRAVDGSPDEEVLLQIAARYGVHLVDGPPLG
jgi:hypothetical protein